MKKLSIILLVCLFGKIVSAQSTSPKREVGLQFNSLNLTGNTPFYAIYKKQVRENVFNRVSLAVGNAGFGRNFDDTNYLIFGASIAIGREKRKQLDPKLTFYRGYQFTASTSFGEIDDNRSVNARIGAGLIFGLQHNFNDRWAINLETDPTVSIGYVKSNGKWSSSINAGFSNTVALGIVRHF